MTICERVFSLLASDGRDQKDLAMHIGVSTRTVSTWKTRGTNPGAEYIAGIAEFFSVSTDYILTGEERQYSVSPADEEAGAGLYSGRDVPPGRAGSFAARRR